jgi:hypothetical protein
MGKNITLVGGNGDGQTTKVANQIIVALTIQAVGEALLFASKAGADPAKVRQALMGGFASSKILEVHGERMVKRTFNPGFRIELHQKDLNLALASGRQMECRFPIRPRRRELFNACVANGHGKLDHSALVKALGAGQSRDWTNQRVDFMSPEATRSFLRSMFDAAVAAAMPQQCVPQNLPKQSQGRTLVVGTGKASAAWRRPWRNRGMVRSGLIVTRYGHAVPASRSRL